MNQKGFLFGGTSIVGWALVQKYSQRLTPFCNRYVNIQRFPSFRQLNLEDRRALKTLFTTEQPPFVLHCGGICDVNKCEANPDWAHLINVKAMASLLEYLPRQTKLIYISSDHVFGGRNQAYTETDKPTPISVYGRSRVLAEKCILDKRPDSLILRTSLAIGPSFDGKKGHLDWLRYRTQQNLPLTIVKDEIRSVGWATDLAEKIMAYVQSNESGLRHIQSKNVLSRIELANFLNNKFNIGARFNIVSRKEKNVPHLGRVELKSIYKDKLANELSYL